MNEGGKGMNSLLKIFLISSAFILLFIKGAGQSALGVGPVFQTECGNYNGLNTLTFIYPVGQKSAVKDCNFVNPSDLSELQCSDGAGLGQISICVPQVTAEDQLRYETIPKLYAVVLGCGFDPDCQSMGQHHLIYRNFTDALQDDVDFTHSHYPDLDAERPPGIPQNLWAIQAVFPCDEIECGPQVRIESVPTSLSEVKAMIEDGKLFAFPFPRHFPAALPADDECPNMVLRIPILEQACDPGSHHVD